MHPLISFLYKHRTRLCIAAGIAIFGLVLRVNMALNSPVEWDEPVYLNAAILYAGDIRAGNFAGILSETYNYEHPIFYKLIYAAVLSARSPVAGLDSRQMLAGSILRSSPYFKRFLSLRAVSVVFGSLGVFLLGLISPLAGLFLAINTYAVKYTSVIYLEALPLALSIAGVSAYTRSRVQFSGLSINKRAPSTWLAISAACFGAAAASKYIYALPALAVGTDLLFLAARAMAGFFPNWASKIDPSPNPRSKEAGESRAFALNKIIRSVLLWAGLLMISFFAANPAILADPAARFSRSVAYSVHYAQSNDEVSRAGYPFWQPLSWLSISIPRQPTRIDPFFIRPGNFWLAVDEIMLPLALVGVWRLRQKYPVFAIWLVLGLVFLLVWNTKWPQYILAILPPFCLSAALGAQWLGAWVWKILHPSAGLKNA